MRVDFDAPCARGGIRTHTPFRAEVFKTSAAADYATRALSMIPHLLETWSTQRRVGGLG
jgi:hypothetical protein